MASILIIDNDPQIIGLYGEFLSATGHEVVSADNGLQGLKLFNSRAFDLVITEISMPGVDGFEVILNLKMKLLCPKIITTGVDETLLKMAKDFGADRTLFKPFSRDELLACLNAKKVHRMPEPNTA